MTNPYVDTTFKILINVRPNQLNNDVRENIKTNLIEEYENKCFKKYGFISKIYDVIDCSEGRVFSDNGFSLVSFTISFSCQLCKPIPNDQIICKIKQVTEELIKLENGPMKMFVTPERINKQLFFIDNHNNIRLTQTKEKLTNASCVKATILQIMMNDKDTVITALGSINDIATEEEIASFNEYVPMSQF